MIRYDGSTEETRAQGLMDLTRALVLKFWAEGFLDDISPERVKACTDQSQLDTWLRSAESRFFKPEASED
ncbi:hypothetical protein [Glycomyces sp. YM15]|uniref:hypothetical protein n=1 Tax=Glycomyces sp. YM15 TaxID=2800446 RepID=UPI0019628BF6|nr:hypothetical protein [Glycomyces sp. YM15]